MNNIPSDRNNSEVDISQLIEELAQPLPQQTVGHPLDRLQLDHFNIFLTQYFFYQKPCDKFGFSYCFFLSQFQKKLKENQFELKGVGFKARLLNTEFTLQPTQVILCLEVDDAIKLREKIKMCFLQCVGEKVTLTEETVEATSFTLGFQKFTFEISSNFVQTPLLRFDHTELFDCYFQRTVKAAYFHGLPSQGNKKAVATFSGIFAKESENPFENMIRIARCYPVTTLPEIIRQSKKILRLLTDEGNKMKLLSKDQQIHLNQMIKTNLFSLLNDSTKESIELAYAVFILLDPDLFLLTIQEKQNLDFQLILKLLMIGEKQKAETHFNALLSNKKFSADLIVALFKAPERDNLIVYRSLVDFLIRTTERKEGLIIPLKLCFEDVIGKAKKWNDLLGVIHSHLNKLKKSYAKNNALVKVLNPLCEASAPVIESSKPKPPPNDVKYNPNEKNTGNKSLEELFEEFSQLFSQDIQKAHKPNVLVDSLTNLSKSVLALLKVKKDLKTIGEWIQLCEKEKVRSYTLPKGLEDYVRAVSTFHFELTMLELSLSEITAAEKLKRVEQVNALLLSLIKEKRISNKQFMKSAEDIIHLLIVSKEGLLAFGFIFQKWLLALADNIFVIAEIRRRLVDIFLNKLLNFEPSLENTDLLIDLIWNCSLHIEIQIKEASKKGGKVNEAFYQQAYQFLEISSNLLILEQTKEKVLSKCIERIAIPLELFLLAPSDFFSQQSIERINAARKLVSLVLGRIQIRLTPDQYKQLNACLLQHPILSVPSEIQGKIATRLNEAIVSIDQIYETYRLCSQWNKSHPLAFESEDIGNSATTFSENTLKFLKGITSFATLNQNVAKIYFLLKVEIPPLILIDKKSVEYSDYLVFLLRAQQTYLEILIRVNQLKDEKLWEMIAYLESIKQIYDVQSLTHFRNAQLLRLVNYLLFNPIPLRIDWLREIYWDLSNRQQNDRITTLKIFDTFTTPLSAKFKKILSEKSPDPSRIADFISMKEFNVSLLFWQIVEHEILTGRIGALATLDQEFVLTFEGIEGIFENMPDMLTKSFVQRIPFFKPLILQLLRTLPHLKGNKDYIQSFEELAKKCLNLYDDPLEVALLNKFLEWTKNPKVILSEKSALQSLKWN